VKWHLGFPEYLIGDGAYPELSRGQEIDSFALEFHPRSLRIVPPGPKEARLVAGCEYRVVAEILYAVDRACVIDFGLRAACDLAGRDVPEGIRAGSFIAGEIYIGIPLCIPVIPEQLSLTLKHKWRIEGIGANVTPLVESVSSSGLKFRHYDASRTAYEEVSATNTGAMNYVLHCEQLD
jgi:hypothetical protein